MLFYSRCLRQGFLFYFTVGICPRGNLSYLYLYFLVSSLVLNSNLLLVTNFMLVSPHLISFVSLLLCLFFFTLRLHIFLPAKYLRRLTHTRIVYISVAPLPRFGKTKFPVFFSSCCALGFSIGGGGGALRLLGFVLF